MPRKKAKPPLCQCIGCGCDDLHACPDLLGDPCSWLVRSQSGRLGVCSGCPLTLRLWSQGKRYFSPRAKEAIGQRIALERAARTVRRKLHNPGRAKGP